ncbi:flagellin-like protein [Desulfallas thermosapovorans DSM 6562]|uniref:Flagellin-like protein n=1 Tax=Desulfallas thermosapovorans DSM 6562 TaxID=1121431 RepID=A0A5S4ZRI1_9FIRM|nr:flagellin-like protein [Desulfallas thermosapovorans DSM 6562]
MNCWKTLRALHTTTQPETADVKVEKMKGLGNQQPSPCAERLGKVQRLGHTTCGRPKRYGDEARRARKKALEVPGPAQARKSAAGEDIVWSTGKPVVATMAKEMMEFTKMNILSQAAQAMLAQANQQPQGVLQLLR